MRPDIATSHLETAFKLYNDLGLYDDANKARIVAGISKGESILLNFNVLDFKIKKAQNL